MFGAPDLPRGRGAPTRQLVMAVLGDCVLTGRGRTAVDGRQAEIGASALGLICIRRARRRFVRS